MDTGIFLIGPDVPLGGVLASDDRGTVLSEPLDAEIQSGTLVSESPARTLVVQLPLYRQSIIRNDDSQRDKS